MSQQPDVSDGVDAPEDEPQQGPVQDFLEDEAPNEEVEHPTRLLRIAHMVRTMLDEVRTTDLDEAGRERLADVHNRTIAALSEIVSDDLRDELTASSMQLDDEDTPSASELRVAQAQLAGWLEGLFRGIQASMASQQHAAARQLQQMQRHALEGGDGKASGRGQYL